MKRIITAAVTAAAVGLCGAAAQAESLKIGFLATLSGPPAVLGQHMRDGFLLGVKQAGGKLGGLDTEVIVVDDDIDARDWKDVMWAISTRMDPVRDVTLIENTPIDYLDFASPESGLGGKIGLDATNKWPPETKREWGRKIHMDDTVVEEVTRKWAAYGLPGSGKPIWK